MTANAPSPAPVRLFAGKTHVGLFETVAVEKAGKGRPTHFTGAFSIGQRARFMLREAVPSMTMTEEVMLIGQKGLGDQAGALGLQDWLPDEPGEMLTLAFDSNKMSRAREFECLGRADKALAAWSDSQRFFDCCDSGGTISAASVASTIANISRPQSTFFRLMFQHDRAPYSDAAVIHALGAYFGDSAIPAMDRRTIVAFYTSQPESEDTGALASMAAGLFQLVFDLAAAEMAASAGVVIQRIYGFLHQPGSGYLVPAPAEAVARAEAIRQLMAWPPASVTPLVQKSVGEWLGGR
jgi:hypothetical protein